MSRDNARTLRAVGHLDQRRIHEGTPWIPVQPNFSEINVEASLADPDSSCTTTGA